MKVIFERGIQELIEMVEQQIRNIYELINITQNDRTIRMYCRMLVIRMEHKKALTKVVSA
ncbi:hypothetical protein [Paenibacillus alba]|uniref:Uncharacterized protein n=1 Tax=Paenibacillus alba TaxID=1197127 RepID=A0ABU6GEF3_9BACL|nr:hypothetical protein [Paenibacillus alba]MEC0231148.1 hypothetical protein [Paenibacillus alba]